MTKDNPADVFGKKLFYRRSDKFEIKMKIKLIGAIGVLLNWKISRNYTERCPKRRKGSTGNGDKVEKQTRIRSSVVSGGDEVISKEVTVGTFSGLMKSTESQ